MTTNGHQGSFGVDGNDLKIVLWSQLNNSVNLLNLLKLTKFTKTYWLYTLKSWNLWQILFLSKAVFKKSGSSSARDIDVKDAKSLDNIVWGNG